MLTRRSLFAVLTGAVAAACGWKAKPAEAMYWEQAKPVVFHPGGCYVLDAQSGIRMRIVNEWAKLPPLEAQLSADDAFFTGRQW